MKTKQSPLPICTRVEILKHRPGWIARVAHYSEPCGFYTVRLLMTADGHEIEQTKHDGPYTRQELRPLTDPQPGPSGPTLDAQGRVSLLEATA